MNSCRLSLCFCDQSDGAPCGLSSISPPSLAEFSVKSEDKDGNSLALQFLSGEKVTVVASKTSRESGRRPAPPPHQTGGEPGGFDVWWNLIDNSQT